MEAARAFARIDHGSAVVGNRFAERVWSTFMGYTVSILEKPSGREWTRRRSPEFFFATPDDIIDVMTLGEISWSEFYTPYGAGLCCEKYNDDLSLSLDVMCFHACAGIRRVVALTNTSGAPLTIRHAAFEALAMPAMVDLEVVRAFAPPAGANAPEAWRWAAVTGDGGGMVFGAAGACEFRADSPEQGQCSWIFPDVVTLAPGERFAFPETMLAHVYGALEEGVEGVLSGFFACRAEAEAWEEEVRRAEVEGMGESHASD